MDNETSRKAETGRQATDLLDPSIKVLQAIKSILLIFSRVETSSELDIPGEKQDGKEYKTELPDGSNLLLLIFCGTSYLCDVRI